MARHGYSGDALIEVLHAAQQMYGYLPPDVLRHIARGLKLPPSRVMGVATFYHLFHTHARQPHRITICEGTACYVAGSKALAERAAARKWELDIGRCVGFCGLAPVVVCDGVTTGRLDPAGLDALLRGKEKADDR